MKLYKWSLGHSKLPPGYNLISTWIKSATVHWPFILNKYNVTNQDSINGNPLCWIEKLEISEPKAKNVCFYNMSSIC